MRRHGRTLNACCQAEEAMWKANTVWFQLYDILGPASPEPVRRPGFASGSGDGVHRESTQPARAVELFCDAVIHSGPTAGVHPNPQSCTHSADHCAGGPEQAERQQHGLVTFNRRTSTRKTQIYWGAIFCCCFKEPICKADLFSKYCSFSGKSCPDIREPLWLSPALLPDTSCSSSPFPQSSPVCHLGYLNMKWKEFSKNKSQIYEANSEHHLSSVQ